MRAQSILTAILIAVICTAGVTFFTGCSTASAGGGPTVRPEPGTLFIWQITRTDSTGKVTPIPDGINFEKVAATGVAVKGQNNVSLIVSANGDGSTREGDTTFTAYMANGDVAWFQAPTFVTSQSEAHPLWITLPTASKGRIVHPDDESLKYVDGVRNVITRYIGSEPMLIGTTMIMTEHIHFLISSKPTGSIDESDGGHWWYAPSLGCVVKREIQQPDNSRLTVQMIGCEAPR